MASNVPANVSAVNVSASRYWCLINDTEIQRLIEAARNMTDASPARPHWLDNAYKIAWTSMSVFLDSISCFVGIVCACLALVVLFQRKRQQGNVSSALYLQRAMVVVDLCYLLTCVYSWIIYNGYYHHIFHYASSRDRYNHRFAFKIFYSAEDCIAMISVWLIAIITIDR